MDDQEYEKIRAQRLQQLQQQSAANQKLSSDAERQQQQQQQHQEQMKEKEDEIRNTILAQILTQEARARLNTLKTAKPDKAKMVEDILINNARMGAIAGRLSEDDLKSVLEKVSQQFSKQTKVKFDRRRAGLDSDDDDY